MIDRVNSELESRNFFNKNQHGFRKAKSTILAATELIKQIKKAKRRRFAIVLALDISSTFERMGWMHVLKNVEKAGARRCYLQTIKQLLIGRRVEYDHRTMMQKTKHLEEIRQSAVHKASPVDILHERSAEQPGRDRRRKRHRIRHRIRRLSEPGDKRQQTLQTRQQSPIARGFACDALQSNPEAEPNNAGHEAKNSR